MAVSSCPARQVEPPHVESDKQQNAKPDSRPLANDDQPPLLVQLKERTDELRFDKFISRSSVEAEQFRRSLKARKNEPGGARSLAAACEEFQAQINRRMEFQRTKRESDSEHGKASIRLSRDLTRFQLNSKGIQQAIYGNEANLNALSTYGGFEGKWFGIWDKMKVDHHWGAYVSLEKPQTFSVQGGAPVTLHGYQYAWVGDGYGLNHLASTNNGKENFLLGYVVHVRDQDPEKENVRRPHVGVIDGPDRLIWITNREVFFEEMITGAKPEQDKYIITGFRYACDANSLEATEGFQAVYSRDSQNRVPWQKFEVAIDVKLTKK